MTQRFHARGSIDVELKDGELHIHKTLSRNPFTILGGKYYLEKGGVGDYQFLTLFPQERWDRELKNRRGMGINYKRGIYHNDFRELDVLVDEQGARFSIPVRFLRYLGLELNSTVRVIGIVDSLEIWKPKNFEEPSKTIKLEELALAPY